MNTTRSFSRRHFVLGSTAIAAVARSSRAGATSSDTFRVNTNGLRLRSGPGLGYSVLASLSAGTQVTFLESGGAADGYNWARIKVNATGKVGYVAFKFLSSPAPAGWPDGSTVHVSTASGGGANLRSFPRTDSGVIKVIPHGTTGTTVGEGQAGGGYFWYQVNVGGTSG